jgi:hypothetical protein
MGCLFSSEREGYYREVVCPNHMAAGRNFTFPALQHLIRPSVNKSSARSNAFAISPILLVQGESLPPGIGANHATSRFCGVARQ